MLSCPHCGNKLFYDPNQKKLLRAVPGTSAEKGFSLEQAVADLKTEQSRADERFREAMEAENRRKTALSGLFEKSLKEAGKDPRPPVRPFDFD